MTTRAEPLRFTADAFIAWAMDQPRGRFELHHGQVVAMAPERVGPARVKARAHRALEDAVARAGLAARRSRTAYPSGSTRPPSSNPTPWCAAGRARPTTWSRFPTRSSWSRWSRRRAAGSTAAPSSPVISGCRASGTILSSTASPGRSPITAATPPERSRRGSCRTARWSSTPARARDRGRRSVPTGHLRFRCRPRRERLGNDH